MPALFHMDVKSYLPFLTVGLVVWSFLSTIIIEGCQTFLSSQGVITQVRMPFSVHAWRTVYRNLIVLAHNMVIIPVVLVVFSVPVSWQAIFILPALVILTINGMWVSILLGMVSARYRDVPPIVASFVQVILFVTPIFWPPEQIGAWMQVLSLNPLFSAIDVIRSPLLGKAPLPYSWPVLLVVTVVGSLGHLRNVRQVPAAHHVLDLGMAFLRLQNLSVDFPIYQESRSLKKFLVSTTTQGNLARDATDRVNVHALNDLTLNIEDGDRVGLIGANGAGKTTLLRVLAGIYHPTRGRLSRRATFQHCSTSVSVSIRTRPAWRTSSCAACT